MAKKRIIRVFVASPSDVRKERTIISKVIQEINLTMGDDKNIRLELIKWETHTYPSVGIDAQSVINKQIADNYDIFIGIMGMRFGSPTRNASSGTEEEFDRAYTRYIHNPQRLRLMFYFKNPTVKYWDIDLEHAFLIKEFRTKLEQKGLYWMFNTTEEFKDSVRVHLIKQVESLLKDVKLPLKIHNEKNVSNELKKSNTWFATNNISSPQWADYKKLFLNGKLFRSFNCRIATTNDYFRFGFKFLKKQGRLFGDGSIQSQDNNCLVHIGKNQNSNSLFITTYINGIRQRPDKNVGFSITKKAFNIALDMDKEDFLHFYIENNEVHKVRINKEIRKNVYMLAWGDSGNEISIKIDNIKYRIAND